MLDFLTLAAQEADAHDESRLAVSMRILQANILLRQSTESHEPGGRLARVRAILEELRDIVTQINDRTQYAWYRKIEGHYHLTRGDIGQGLQYLREAHELFHQLARPALVAEVQELLERHSASYR